uniref:Golgi apparatus protein 1 n=1 Tax=Plectus sambesii TaxID=2011161 RepID=A0A914W435_9BILA
MMKSCIRKSLGASVLICCLIGGVMAQQQVRQDGRNDQDDRMRVQQEQVPRNQGAAQAPLPVDQGRQQANAPRESPQAPAQPQRQAVPNRPVAGGPSQEKDDGQPHIINYQQCKEDIAKHCNREDINLKSDMAVLECLQDAAQIEAEALSSPCEHLVWEFKVNLTSDARFQRAAEEFCKEEMISIPAMGKCSSESKSGYLLSCLLESITLIPKESRCYKFLLRTERLAFSDFRLVGPFVRACGNLVQKFECGSLNPPDAASKTPHSQGTTLECMIQKIIESSKKAKDAMQDIDTECRHEIMRIAELQSEDFHLDRPLFFACRSDREAFCKGVQSGEGRIFECLMQHRNEQQMTANCTQILGERAQLMGQNYRLSHPLLDGCKNELKAHGCAPQGAEAAEHFHLSWVLLCLENAAHSSSQQFGDSCKHEMITHRQMMMSEHRLSPEIVLTCAQDIDRFCSKEGLLIENMGTIHCLMKKASERVRKESDALQSQCLQAINTIVKIADIGSNYKVDKVLYASCRNLIDGKCSLDAVSESETLTCLMKHLDDSDMTDQCEQRLLEIQYFMARDWTLDPELYRACHSDAVAKCKAFDNWHQQANDKKIPDPGPQVLACLYRSAYDEQEPLQRDCAKHVRRVLRTRAVRVQLIPEIEESCRDALSEFCSTKTAAGEEMQCLQDNFETEDFQARYKQCYAELKKFTEYESKDVKLNRALSKACRPVIEAHCNVCFFPS